MLENSTNTFSPLVNDTVRTPGGTFGHRQRKPDQRHGDNAGTNVIFTPANDFTGTATIGYTITDGIGGTNTFRHHRHRAGAADIAVSKSGPAIVYAGDEF